MPDNFGVQGTGISSVADAINRISASTGLIKGAPILHTGNDQAAKLGKRQITQMTAEARKPGLGQKLDVLG